MAVQWGRSSPAQNSGCDVRLFATLPGKAVGWSPLHIFKKLSLVCKETFISEHSRTLQDIPGDGPKKGLREAQART